MAVPRRGAYLGAKPLHRPAMNTSPAPLYELRYTSLFNEGRALSFPCDRTGRVQLDALSERARQNYLHAQAGVGREFSVPAVRASGRH